MKTGGSRDNWQTETIAANSESTKDKARKRRRPKIARVASLDSLVGAHPLALRDIYDAGEACDPAAFREGSRGLLLSFDLWRETFMLARPIVRGLSRILPWKGKVFESGGTSGANQVLNWQLFRFRSEVTESRLDGKPTLMISYDGLDNPWPVADFVDELRKVGDDVYIGPAYTMSHGEPRVLFWWGLTTTGRV